jgi:rSAM/selenodomain-associated transferase 2
LPAILRRDGSELRIAIVVPTLDEEVAASRLLAEAARHGDELVVSDGGSRDRTVEIAREVGARVVAGAPGRGGQLNRGAAAAGGDVLVFLHADTRLPEGAAEAIRAAVGGGAVGGGFRVRFDDAGMLYRFGAGVANLRARWTRLPLGDHAQFVTRAAFEQLGGFAEWPILEDVDFMRRLRCVGRIAVLDPPVVTSARRFHTSGPIRTVARNWLIWTLFTLGISPTRLARLYRDVR